MIDKLQPRKLDKSTDYKLVQKTSMIDALNLYVSDQNGEASAGVIKPVLGTEALEFTDGTTISSSDVRVLGSTVDDLTGVLYFYVWTSTPSETGVYAYDKRSILSPDGGLIKVFTSDVFNFPPDGFVKGDIVYKKERNRPQDSTIPDVDSLLYFTDNVNEPRKLDVYRALFADDMPTLVNPEDYYKVHDILCACPKVPMGNVDYTFEADTTKEVSNFENIPGIQFAVQGVYTDGSVTAIGPYSKIAFPPSVVNRGAAPAAKVLNHNVCKIKIPPYQEDFEFVKILFRYGNKASFRELAEVPNQGSSSDENWNSSTREYSFYNDQVAKGVSPSDVAKTFDNLPRQARAQAVVSNRLVFSNFRDGFDPYKPEVTTTVLFKNRPAEGTDFTIDIVPTIETTSGPAGSPGTVNEANVFNKVMGFEIDSEQIPDDIPADTTISVSFSFSPDKNFHVFDSRGSYQQSQHRGPVSGNFRGFPNQVSQETDDQGTQRFFFGRDGNFEDVQDITEATFVAEEGSAGYLLNDGGGSEGWISALNSGQGGELSGNSLNGLKFNLDNLGNPQPAVNAFFGRNFGVGYRLDNGADSNNYVYKGVDGVQVSLAPEYQYVSGQNASPQKSKAGYGTSAGAPLIIQGGKLSFNVSFRIEQAVANGRVVVAQTIEDIMVRRAPQFGNVVTVLNSQSSDTLSVDVGINDGDKIYMSEAKASLISAVADIGNADNPDAMMDFNNILQINQIDGGRNRRVPMHYFILNKADVKFFFEPSERSEELAFPRKSFQLAIANIEPDADEGLITCIKRPEHTAPWYCMSKQTVDSIIDDNQYDSVVDNYVTEIGDNAFLDFDGINLDIESLEDTNSYRINTKSVGRIKCFETDGEGNSKFFPHSIDIDAEDYVPGANYLFSLLDGAGGPGGTPPGANSAYGRHRNDSFGSVAAQMIATFHGAHGDGAQVREKLINMVPSLGDGYGVNVNGYVDPAPGIKDVSVVGGVYLVNNANEASIPSIGGGNAFGNESVGPVRTKMAPRVVNSDIPSQADIFDQFGGVADVDDSTLVTYVLTGPFFTGSIALNPIATDPEAITGAVNNQGDNDQGYLSGNMTTQTNGYNFLNKSPINNLQGFNPAGTYDQTTTMPYIFSGSFRESVNEDQVTYNTSFPFPVLDPLNELPSPVDSGLFTVYEQKNSPLISDLYDFGVDGLSTALGWDGAHPTFGSISFEDKPGHAEMGSVATSVSGASSKPIMSFKANANHEFGIIYYDERGRHGRVNHLTSVYVPGFSPSERNGIADGGPAHIQMRFDSDPPEWARYYKIAYSKNTSISKFFQYTAGGAFITAGENPIDSGLSSAKIYVSLNYLQGHPISYANSWGGKSQDGSPVIYQPKQGDKVRVISFQRSSENQVEKVFPKNIVFDVVGIESLDDSDSNPLWDEQSQDPVPANRQGLFLTIRNNPDNTHFSYADIEQENHYWGSNAIIEIYRPVEDLAEEDRLYFEIGPTYRCGNPLVNTGELGSAIQDATQFKHLNHNNEDGPIEITDGDVFFRRTALNMRQFEGGEFVDLIRSEFVDVDNDTDTPDEWIVTAEPNFKSIYTESMSASDLFKSDAISIGRPNKIDNDEKEVLRIASLVHSDKDIAKSSKVGYSSFNGSESNDEELDISHGQVDYIANTNDSLFVIQNNRVSQIPVDRNLISTADNEPSLISSSKFLNTPRYYAGRAGTDGHPESVAMENGNAYFVHKSDGCIFLLS